MWARGANIPGAGCRWLPRRNRGLRRRLFPGVFHHGADFDDGMAGMDKGAGPGQGRGMFEVFRLDQDKSADRLLGFQEGTVGDDIIFGYIIPPIVQGAGIDEVSRGGHLIDPIPYHIALAYEVFRRELRPAFEVFADE